ncbi:MAG TPA: hypothetical protein VM120_18295 [Bryobacteraceae bacterium]|nr:hypothetical protein [Bryobacteraceae bacterium]
MLSIVVHFAPLLLAQGVTDVGPNKQLFIDHKFIEMSDGVRLTVNPPHQTRERLVVLDQPWENDGRMGSYSTIIEENGKYRLWYNVMAGTPPPGQNPPFLGLAYAESADGVHFTKPILNLVERNGSKANNLVIPPDPRLVSVAGGTVWRDENPNCPPDRRYKSWAKFYPKPGSHLRGPHRLWYSADGIKWHLDERLMTGLRAADTQPSWFWDPRVNRYVAYSREWVRERAGFGARMASYNESDDMIHWDSMAMALEPDERDMTAMPAMMIDPRTMVVKGEDVLPQRERRGGGEQGADQVLTPTSPLDFYGPGVFPYEGVYMALIPVFYHWSGSGIHTFPSTADLQFAVSRDGRHFSRPLPRAPFLRTGPDGSFDSKWLYPLLRPVRRGDELWIYYSGTNHDHSGRVDAKSGKDQFAISRAILRLDGFMSADADYEGGWFLTPALRFAGTRLELNIDTSAGGLAMVEILEASGKPIPGFMMVDADPINANSTRVVVSWRGKTDISAWAGKAVRLRVKMRSAKLYAFQFREK